jgi:hypothetical protein
MLRRKCDIQLHCVLMEGEDSAALKINGRRGLNNFISDFMRKRFQSL